jgi:hypothetical protein
MSLVNPILFLIRHLELSSASLDSFWGKLGTINTTAMKPVLGISAVGIGIFQIVINISPAIVSSQNLIAEDFDTERLRKVIRGTNRLERVKFCH